MIFAPDCAPEGVGARLVGDELEAWLVGHGAASQAAGDFVRQSPSSSPKSLLLVRCREVSIGPRHEAGLACERSLLEGRDDKAGAVPVFRAVSYVALHAIRQGRIVRLFEAPYNFDVFDKEAAEQKPLFALHVDFAPELGKLVLREPSPGACARAISQYAKRPRGGDDAKSTAGRAWADFDRHQVGRICAAARPYTWDGTAFRPVDGAHKAPLRYPG